MGTKSELLLFGRAACLSSGHCKHQSRSLHTLDRLLTIFVGFLMLAFELLSSNLEISSLLLGKGLDLFRHLRVVLDRSGDPTLSSFLGAVKFLLKVLQQITSLGSFFLRKDTDLLFHISIVVVDFLLAQVELLGSLGFSQLKTVLQLDGKFSWTIFLLLTVSGVRLFPASFAGLLLLNRFSLES